MTTPGRELRYAPPVEAGPSSLTEAQLAEFRERGFLAIEHLACEADVIYVRGVIEHLFNIKAGHNEGAYFNFAGADDDPNAPHLPQILRPCNYADGLRKTALYRQAYAIARQILGPEARFTFDHALNKPALIGPATPWHQDESFRHPIFDYEEISIWVPLQPVGDANGCMEFIPGSHRGEVLAHRSPNNDRRAHALECCGDFDLSQAISCPLPAGGCTIHTARTLHGTGLNRSPAPRLAYVLSFGTPPRPAAQPRTFPWLDEKDTAQLRRQRGWMRRTGIFVKGWRTLKRTEPQDYMKLVSKLVRKAMRQRWK
ncbi:MAG: phytanoyl-CoA dioxygenase family protein [Chthoniobacteraceae bacterium]